MNDISQYFRWNPLDAAIAKEILKYEGTPEAIGYFSRVCNRLSDYSYWFLLSTLWVSYTGYSDLGLWKQLFSSNRNRRKKSIMKPSEVKAYDYLPYFVTAYRAHRPNEIDCIAYTINKDTAFRFAKERKVDTISEYKIKKTDIVALFLRRGEDEIIVLDKGKITFIKKHSI
ncbi:MAG: hypothetical protein E6231_03120 [Bacillota bacterium]|nr:hypothetical protein [Bacillota bacterium]